jgi:hypothetical protein
MIIPISGRPFGDESCERSHRIGKSMRVVGDTVDLVAFILIMRSDGLSRHA